MTKPTKKDWEKLLFGRGKEVIEISIYRKDGKILSIPWSMFKKIIQQTINQE